MRFKATIHSLLIIGLGVATSTLNAQDMHIYYNLFNDSITYKVDGKVVEDPKLKNGQDLHFHFTEFNNFLYDLELEFKQEEVQSSSGVMAMAQLAGLSPGLPGLGMGIGGESMGASGGLGLMDVPVLDIDSEDLTLSSLISNLIGGSRGSAEMLTKANTTMEEISTIRKEVQQLTDEIASYERSREVAQLALGHVDSLKRHPNLKPSFIKQRCTEYYQQIFLTPDVTGITLEELLATQKIPARHEAALARLRSRGTTLNAKVKLLTNLNEQFVNLALDDQDYLKYVSNLQTFRKDAQSFDKQLQGALQVTESLTDYPNRQELTNLQFSLAEVVSNDFMYNSTTTARSDVLNIDIRMVKKDRRPGEEKALVKTRNIRLETKGGLKISASVGLNFSRFLSPDQTFDVRNSLIVGDDAGAFAPAAVSMLHFYSYNGKKISLGGSFGIGFPLLAGPDESQSLQFFIGPSLIFGTSQRMILNFGVMGGRATRLGRGYQIGDEFDYSLGDIPTRNPYEFGVFVGTSFNLMGN